MESSTYKVEVVPVKLEAHPDADSLSVVRVFGYTCVVRTSDWQHISLGAYITPDSLVDTSRPEFAFLADKARSDGKSIVKAKRLRGVISFGLLVPAPAGSQIGDNVAEELGVEHYNKETNLGTHLGGETSKPPNLFFVKYDLDSFRRHHSLFVENEPVIVTEKLDGTSARYVFWDDQMCCGSRAEWKKEYPDYSHVTVEKLVGHGKTVEEANEIIEKLCSKKTKNIYWKMLEKYPGIEEFCRKIPGCIVYGEIYGSVNAIKYGLPDGNRFACFDLMRDGRWLDTYEARAATFEALHEDLPWVPYVPNSGFYNFDETCRLAEGNTLVKEAKSGTLREGVVIKPTQERRDDHIGRVCFKCVGGGFLEKYR